MGRSGPAGRPHGRKPHAALLRGNCLEMDVVDEVRGRQISKSGPETDVFRLKVFLFCLAWFAFLKFLLRRS